MGEAAKRKDLEEKVVSGWMGVTGEKRNQKYIHTCLKKMTK